MSDAFVPDGFDLETIDLIDPDACCLCRRDFDEIHHTSYYPERVIPVCERCHHRIHNENGYRDDLVPDQSRPFKYDERDGSFSNERLKFTREKRQVRRTCGGGNHEFIEYCVHCGTSKSRLDELGLLELKGGDQR